MKPYETLLSPMEPCGVSRSLMKPFVKSEALWSPVKLGIAVGRYWKYPYAPTMNSAVKVVEVLREVWRTNVDTDAAQNAAF